MASERRREIIEAARQRLTTAKAQAASAIKVLKAALAMSEAAKKEVEAAQDCLRGAKKRWEVIDVVESEEDSTIELSENEFVDELEKESEEESEDELEGETEDESEDESKYDESEDESEDTFLVFLGGSGMEPLRKKRNVAVSPIANGNERGAAPASILRSRTFGTQKLVEVTGCGIAEVNGTYTLANKCTYQKRGLWKGKAVDFIVGRASSGRNSWWVIGPAGGNSIYKVKCGDAQPPKGGWSVTPGKGVGPAPQLTWHF